jgi:mRNA interferase RelE/StbE
MGRVEKGTRTLKYRIEVKRSAAKALKKISKPDQKRISKAIDNLAENLPNPNTTKMKGDNPFHKIRVGDYRMSPRYRKIQGAFFTACMIIDSELY